MKTGSFVLAVLLMVSVLLAACSGNSGNNKNDPAPTPPGTETPQTNNGDNTESEGEPAPDKSSYTGEVVIHNAMYAGMEAMWDAYAADFISQYPNLTIRWVTDPIENLIAAGDPPDLMAWGWINVPWIRDGLVADLGEYIARDGLDLANYLPPALGMQQYEGKTYGLPWITDPNFPIAYNKKVFDQYGQDGIPEINSLASFLEFNKKFWIMSNGEYEMTAMDPLNGYGHYIQLWTYAYMNGVDQNVIYNPETRKAGFNDSRILEALEAMLDFNRQNIDVEALNRLIATLPAHPFATMVNDKQAFNMIVGVIANMYKEGNPNLDLGFEPMPTDALWLGGWGLAMSQPGDNKDAAWEFLKWSTAAKEGIVSLGEHVGFLAAAKSNDWLDAQAQQDPMFQAFKDILANASKTLPVLPVDYVTEFNRLFPEVISGAMPARDFLDHMNNHVQQAIDAFYAG